MAASLLGALGGSFGRVWQPAGGRREEAAGWRSEVGRAIGDLQQMNRRTEAGFLAVGTKLSGFLAAARRVSESATATAERVSGEQGKRDEDSLARVLEATAAMRKGAGSAAGLARLRDSAQRLQRAFQGFDSTVVSFQVLAILARIETARLGESGSSLLHLVEEMRACSGDIASRSQRFLATAGSLGGRVETELERISDLDARGLKALPPLMEAVERDFAALRNRRESGERVVARLGTQFAQVSEAIGEVVRSVQYHDITRQQIEHVIQSLGPLRDGAGPSSRDGPTPQERAVVGLQVAQLDQARRTFLTSAGEIDRQLERVAGRVSEMAAESGNLTGSECSNETFFAEMAGRFEKIMRTARECGACDLDTRRAFREVRQSIEALGAALADIHVIELQLKRVSLNAAIQAVHLGGAGEPLNAVALAMHGLQADCESRSGQGRAELDSIGAAIKAVRGGGMGTAAGERSPMETAVDDLRDRMGEMHAANERSTASCREIGSLASRLSEEIQSARQDLAESRAVTEALEGWCARLRPMASKAGPAALETLPVLESAGQLEECTRNYTMQAEHEVHREMTGVSPPACEPASAGIASGELELF